MFIMMIRSGFMKYLTPDDEVESCLSLSLSRISASQRTPLCFLMCNHFSSIPCSSEKKKKSETAKKIRHFAFCIPRHRGNPSVSL